MRKRYEPPDTRPSWDQPDTPSKVGSATRMQAYDKLPKAIRTALAQAAYSHGDIVRAVQDKVKRRQKVSSIVQWIESECNGIIGARSEAERDAAADFLKDIGLD